MFFLSVWFNLVVTTGWWVQSVDPFLCPSFKTQIQQTMPNGPPWADPGEGGGPGRKSLQAPSASEGGIFFASRPQCTREGQASKEKLVWVLKGASETVSLPAPW